jgi:hypothetical protein
MVSNNTRGFFLTTARASESDKKSTAIITAQSAWIGYPVKWTAAPDNNTCN